MTLIANLQVLKDKLIRLPTDFGVPSYRQLVVRKKYDNEDGFYDHVFDPVPKTVNLNDRQISELISKQTVEISVEDYFVKHISRVQHDREFLTKNIEFYILDYKVEFNVISGIKCRLIFLDESGTTSYAMFLKRLSDHQEIESL
jgi:phospholipase C